MAALRGWKEDREWDRANPENPTCEGCRRRDKAANLIDGLCAECCDDVLFLETGCRFGKVPCCKSDFCDKSRREGGVGLTALEGRRKFMSDETHQGPQTQPPPPQGPQTQPQPPAPQGPQTQPPPPMGPQTR